MCQHDTCWKWKPLFSLRTRAAQTAAVHYAPSVIHILSRDAGVINFFPSLLSFCQLTLTRHLHAGLYNGRAQCVSTLHGFLLLSFFSIIWLLLDFQFASVLTRSVYLWEKVESRAHSAFDFRVYLAIKRYRYSQCFSFLTSRCWCVLRKSPLIYFMLAIEQPESSNTLIFCQSWVL